MDEPIRAESCKGNHVNDVIHVQEGGQVEGMSFVDDGNDDGLAQKNVRHVLLVDDDFDGVDTCRGQAPHGGSPRSRIVQLNGEIIAAEWIAPADGAASGVIARPRNRGPRYQQPRPG
jgi:hypothetical protein